MAVYRRGEICWYEFQIGGTRYRGSTKERKKSAAQQFEAIAISRAREEGLPVFMRSAPVLSDWAKEFLDYCTSQVEAGHLDSDTERYYRGGWRLRRTLGWPACGSTGSKLSMPPSSPSPPDRPMRTWHSERCAGC